MQRFIRDINFMIGHSCGLYWKFCWFFFIPTSLIGILVYSIYTNEEPTYAGIEMSRAAICECHDYMYNHIYKLYSLFHHLIMGNV